MQKYKVLVLTDTTNHSHENSLYALVQAMRLHPHCAQIDVADRANDLNHFFFRRHIPKGLFVKKVDQFYSYASEKRNIKKNELQRSAIINYDIVWLRMPPPLSKPFLDFLNNTFPEQIFINAPQGIYESGSKAFLMNFPNLCPAMKICTTIADIISFKQQFPIVLKPLREYGGRGIIKVDGNQVWVGKMQLTFKQFSTKLADKEFEYLAVQFLTNVTQGDKRIIVVNGKIMGASLRLPAEGSWLCNVAMGGRSIHASIDSDELQIIEKINPTLINMGIVMYGVDTLVNNEGKRILSEINATSIGGLPQIAKQTGQPLVKESIDLIWKYIVEKIEQKNVVNR